MKSHSDKLRRRSIRLKGYDYTQNGAYFVTICTQNRECLFGEIVNGKMQLNDVGQMTQSVWDELPRRYPNSNIDIDVFVVMPNHIHGIIMIANDQNDLGRGEPCVRPNNHKVGKHKIRPYIENINNRLNKTAHPHGTLSGTIGRIVQAFKSITTHEYTIGVIQNGWRPFSGRLWQRNYYEHIIRNEEELNLIREYIIYNPLKWETDQENPLVRITM